QHVLEPVGCYQRITQAQLAGSADGTHVRGLPCRPEPVDRRICQHRTAEVVSLGVLVELAQSSDEVRHIVGRRGEQRSEEPPMNHSEPAFVFPGPPLLAPTPHSWLRWPSPEGNVDDIDEVFQLWPAQLFLAIDGQR